jgi:hypothetical protein
VATNWSFKSRYVTRLDGELRLENRDLYTITIGFIILGLGITLLNLGEGSTFFIFPFFFAGNLAPVFLISCLFIMMMCFWWVNKNWVEDARFNQSHEQRPAYLRVGASCQFCRNPLPENATYCSSCGNPVDQDFGNNVSF